MESNNISRFKCSNEMKNSKMKVHQFVDEGTSADDPLEDELERRVRIENRLIAQMTPFDAVAFVADIHVQVAEFIAEHPLEMVLTSSRVGRIAFALFGFLLGDVVPIR